MKRFKIIFLIVFIAIQVGFAFAQEENLNVFDRWIEWTDGKNMLPYHLNKQAFVYLDVRDNEIEGLKTKEDWITRQKKIKEVLMETVGPFPDKTPLNATVTGVIKKEDYKIEKIVYESMPGFYVTGGLYIPDGKGKKPAILFVSGHTQNAFRYNSYQIMILNLVKKGFIVFAIDPVSQGERVQIYDAEKNTSLIGPTTREHGYLGNQTIINGVSLARYFIWDGIRAVDYLLTRKEVDSERIGVTGQSGGGTQSTYIFAFDERIKAGAPVNYITGFRRLLESIGPQDAEQNFYHGVLNGITHADLLEVRAPNPVLISAGTRDFFSIQGTRETYGEVQKVYKAYGLEENVGLVEDDFGHGYTPKLREGICDFFQKSLNLPGDPKDEDVTILDEEELRITPTGQIATSFKDMETVFTINKKETQHLTEKINDSRKNTDTHLNKVREKAMELSGYVVPEDDPIPVFRGRYRREGYSVEMYALNGEGDCVIPLLLFVPENGVQSSGIIYINPQGKAADAAVGGRIEQLVKQGYIVAAPDVMGTGETAGSSSVAMLVGRSLAGIQAGDISRVARFLKSREDINVSKIGGIAIGEICPSLLHAAALDKSIQSVLLMEPLISYRSMAMNKIYDTDYANYSVAGALTAYDLPDLMGCIAPRKIALAEIKNPMKQPASVELIDEELAFPRSVYGNKNSTDNFRILPSEDLESAVKWIFE